MGRKIMVLGIICLFIGAGVVPRTSGVHAQEEPDIPSLNKFLTKFLLHGNIELTYDLDDIPSTIRPESDIVRVDFYINYYVSGLGLKYLAPFLNFLQLGTVPIELTIEDLPENFHVYIAPNVVYPRIDIQKTKTPEHAIVTISCTKNAPAFQTHSISVNAKSNSVKGPFGIKGIISNSENEIPIEIKPGYYSDFQYEYQAYPETSPGKTIGIPINITSYSNARTRLTFEIIDTPEGWNASIDPEIFIGTTVLGEDPTGISTITIQSPGGMGYHDEVAQFIIQVNTWAAGHPDEGIDNNTFLQFTIRSKGRLINSFIECFPLIDVQNSIENLKYQNHQI